MLSKTIITNFIHLHINSIKIDDKTLKKNELKNQDNPYI